MIELKRAVLLEWLTIAWMTFGAVAGLAAGTIAHSVSLTAFGLDSAVEGACAGVLLQRLSFEVRHGPAHSEASERRAAIIVGILLLAAAAYIFIDALTHLVRHQSPEVSVFGIVLTILTIPIVVPLAGAKLRIARDIASRALRADAIGNVVVWYLAAVVLAGLSAQAIFHAWWVDAAASLVVVALLIFEGVEAVRGAEISQSG
jgi:divalent metal cation (Fe/Co/Zn/Cd) transporter